MIKAEPYAKYHFRMIEAKDRGYYVTRDGVLYGPKGVIKVKCRGSQRYPTFTTNWGSVQSIPVHRFAAYCFYGNDVFNKDMVVRHLDANTENISINNLKLGTHSENNLDKPKKDRVIAASKARKSQGYTPLNAKLSGDDIEYILKAYSGLNGRKAPNGFTASLANKFGVSRQVIHKVVTGKSYHGGSYES